MARSKEEFKNIGEKNIRELTMTGSATDLAIKKLELMNSPSLSSQSKKLLTSALKELKAESKNAYTAFKELRNG